MTRMLAWYPTLDSTIDGTPSPPRQAERGAPFSPRLMKTPCRATLSPKGARAEDLARTLRNVETRGAGPKTSTYKLRRPSAVRTDCQGGSRCLLTSGECGHAKSGLRIM